jgi:hypothetical protein
MAYASSRRSYSGSSRGGGGKGNNMMAMAIAAVVVLGAIVGLIAASSGDKPKPVEPPAAAPPPAPVVVAPPKPAGPAYPPLPQAKVDEASRLVKTFPERGAKAQKLADEAMKAKAAGNLTEQQAKLNEARQILNSINDEWNEFIVSLPSNKDYDQEQVAAYYLRAQNGEVAKWTKLLRVMKSEQTLDK